MRTLLQRVVVLMILIGAASPALSQSLVGFFGEVQLQDPDGRDVSVNIRGSNYLECEERRLQALEIYERSGYTVISEGHCMPRFFSFDIPAIKYLKWPPIGPVCLSCPYLVDIENLRVIYPERYKDVAILVEKFQVKQYLEEVGKLQQKFNIEKFETQLFELENKQLDQREAFESKFGY